MGDGMLETQKESMETETAYRVAAVPVFDVATNGMADISGMHANLILAASLQLIFHKREITRAVKCEIMRDSQLPAVVNRR